MKPLLPDDMAEATRLTRSGRLSEAVALIQNVIRGGRAGTNTPAANAASPSVIALSSPGLDAIQAVDPGAAPQTILSRALGALDLKSSRPSRPGRWT